MTFANSQTPYRCDIPIHSQKVQERPTRKVPNEQNRNAYRNDQSLLLSALANKVRTQVGYDASGRARTWGLLCDGDGDSITIMEYFKLYFDSAHRDNYPDRPSVHEAKQYFKDYMTFLFTHQTPLPSQPAHFK